MWFLPAYFLLLDRFNPEACLKHYHGPVKFVVRRGRADQIHRPGFRRPFLLPSCAGPKDLQVFAGARHNDVSGQLPGWWREVFSFWQQNEAFQSESPLKGERHRLTIASFAEAVARSLPRGEGGEEGMTLGIPAKRILPSFQNIGRRTKIPWRELALLDFTGCAITNRHGYE